MKDMLAFMLKHTDIYRYQLHFFFQLKKKIRIIGRATYVSAVFSEIFA